VLILSAGNSTTLLPAAAGRDACVVSATAGRGGLRSHRGAGGRTRDQLYDEAKRKNIKGRSKMNKAELEEAVSR